MLNLRLNYFIILLTASLIFSCNKNSNKAVTTNEEVLIQKALEIHNRVLTLDTHADTPLRMIQPGFDMSERHDPRETGSKVDYPRMIEGGLDAIFFDNQLYCQRKPNY